MDETTKNGTTARPAGRPGAPPGGSGQQPPLPQPKKLPPTPKKEQPEVEGFKDLSDKELIAIINRHHDQFVGCLLNGIVGHARVAGAALLQMKGRVPKNKWRGWLAENFQGSAETSTL